MRVLVLAAALFFASSTASAQRFAGASEATLLGTATNAGFGLAVAMSGDGSRVAVGQYDGFNPGAVLVYLRSGTSWSLESTIAPADGAMSDGLGTALAMTPDATRMVVGAPNQFGAPTGVIRIYTRTGATWSLEARLTITTSAFGPPPLHGSAVSISDDGALVVAGAPGVSVVTSYTRSGSAWSTEATITAADTTPFDRFGASVALTGDGSRMIVGAPDATRGGMSYAGAAYVLVHAAGVWTQEVELADATATSSAHYGSAVAIDRTAARGAIGAPGATRVVLLARASTTWSVESTFTAPAFSGTQLGASIVLAPDAAFALVGAPHERQTTTGNGAVHEYVRSGTSWTEAWTLARVPSPVLAGSATGFGTSVAIAADVTRAVVGEPGVGRYPGDAFVYADVGGACTSAATCVSGACVDGACCDGACGAGATDCMGCSAALTGAPEGRCAPLAPSVASTVTCRPSAGVCDVPETCSATASSCPADRFVFTECRPSTMACDPSEYCTGSSATCPPDTSTCGLDAGIDAATPDAAVPDDAATIDAASIADAAADDAAVIDAAAIDAATPDAASSVDAATFDAGHDAGADAGRDAATSDGAVRPADAAMIAPSTPGCGCRATGHGRNGLVWVLFAAMALVWRARRVRLASL